MRWVLVFELPICKAIDVLLILRISPMFKRVLNWLGILYLYRDGMICQIFFCT
jgi:hypothetical protein